MDRLVDFQTAVERFKTDPGVQQAQVQASALAASKQDPARAAQLQEARQFNSASGEIARDITAMQAKLGKLSKSEWKS